ncbi:hypothetical protein ACG1BZ_12215 [Microbulbifer sp. CNSA002]|uniref:hypothetical protein n=1 Tax=Microbulbifer sp. CNSA002 TaxID=3373604 RepID=UPI0039B435CE
MGKINQSVANSSASSFQSLVTVSDDQKLNQTNPPKPSGFKHKLQVVAQRLHGGLAFVVPGLKSNKNTRVPIPNEASSAGKVGRQPVDLGRLVRLDDFSKKAEDILEEKKDLAQLKNLKSKIDKEIEYFQSIATNFELDGEGDVYVMGEIKKGLESLKGLAGKCEGNIYELVRNIIDEETYEVCVEPKKDLTQGALNRSRLDEVYFMRILSTEGSQLNKVWTNVAHKTFTSESTNFLREFGRVINIGVTTEPQEYPTLDEYLLDLYDALTNGLYLGDDETLKNLELIAKEFVETDDGEKFVFTLEQAEKSNPNTLNISGEQRRRVVDGLKNLRSLYPGKSPNNQDSASGSSQRGSKEKNEKDLDSLSSLAPSEGGVSDKLSVATVKSSGSIDDTVSTAINNVLGGYLDIVNEIYSTFMKGANIKEGLEDILQEQNRADLIV